MPAQADQALKWDGPQDLQACKQRSTPFGDTTASRICSHFFIAGSLFVTSKTYPRLTGTFDFI